MMKWVIFLLAIAVMQSCQKSDQELSSQKSASDVTASFTIMPSDLTGVTFSNLSDDFREDYNYNIFKYEYLYNGGGVATGDVNGDSLPDLYFTSTFSSNKLYLNLGDFKFLDVTDPSGVAAAIGFKTGTTMADINGDGKLDIYVCRTGKAGDDHKSDLVFINMGNQLLDGVAIPVFEEQSKKLGLDAPANTNHVCFFDYDRDGDLDLFQLNHRVDFEESTNFRLEQGADGSIIRITTPKTPLESNRLYRNDNGHFTDVTVAADLVSASYGLSVTPADFNKDGWIDLYLAIDYIEPDMLLINNQNGTFTDQSATYLKHTSLNSMGSDVADINNDGLDDIMVLDMKAADPFRYKALINGMQYDRYNLLVQYGYGRQESRNVLQLNNGNHTFSEIGQFAGIAATDWSWGALIADFDNDGWKDTYIANGYRRDVANLDYLNYVRDSLHRTGGLTKERFPDINDILNYVPEKKLSNYLYINNQQLGFTDVGAAAGMDQVSFSNGAAYADLDRDGDLDLIVNNIGDPAFIYRNDSRTNNWLQIEIRDRSANIFGLGAVADLYTGYTMQHQMLITNKGFFSSSEPILHFGLDDVSIIDSIILQWPDGGREILKNVKANQRLTWKRGTGDVYTPFMKVKSKPLFIDQSSLPGWVHREDDFVDFKRERLLPYMFSFEGPCITTGDVNGDQLDDIFIGNGSGFPAALFIQKGNNIFERLQNSVFGHDAIYEDCGSIMEDLDGDGDLDLVVISGGNLFKANDDHYMCRYYQNDGQGTFTRSTSFPIVRTNAGAIVAFDYDQDGDLDIIIGGRNTPGAYPEAPKSFLLQNDRGKFKDVTHAVFPALEHLGMITSIATGDLDGDQIPEIVIVGDWLPITVFSFDGKSFQDRTSAFGLQNTSGWWKTVHLSDMDQDGDLDLFAGNMGLNTRLTASENYPITLVSKDFDANGSIDPILCFYYEDQLYPYAGRDAIIGQLPGLKKKYNRYAPYASATIQDIFSKKELQDSKTYKANTFQTMYFVNENKNFVSRALPYQVQLAPVFDMVIMDFNGDGRKDVLMAGQFQYSETETGEIDSGNGTLLLQQADGSFAFIPNTSHGFWAQKEVRELKTIKLADGTLSILTGNNKGPVEMHLISK